MSDLNAREVRDLLDQDLQSQTGGTGSVTNPQSFNLETIYLQREKVQLGIDMAHLQTLELNNESRKKYANRIFLFTSSWVSIILLIVFFQGFGSEINTAGRLHFNLSEPIIITLITSTTVNVFGFFLLVTKYLFNNKKIERP